ncbi:MAG: tRNA (adenosine(37)-N6)-threonylcarbamoyltransferase complex dimerization subunit type 1 TsaB [Eubacteriales bacterium]|nr:tRNA (adenosine(37)-N6)-threonylcarbamoyltransferase complex dimerization subunit type 1 TsaB [Eubacteriales bacterium]
MRQLSIELSSPEISLALSEGSEIRAYQKGRGLRQHAETLFPMLESILKQVKWERSDLELIAVGTGPGSFTGIRMALTAAKVLAFGLGVKLIGVSGLEIMQEPYRESQLYHLATIDARGGRLYAALWHGEEVLLPEGKYEAETIWAEISNRISGKPLLISGTACEAMVRAQEETRPLTYFVDSHGKGLNAENLAAVAARRADLGQFDSLVELAANYCSLSQAERLRLEAAGQIQKGPLL